MSSSTHPWCATERPAIPDYETGPSSFGDADGNEVSERSPRLEPTIGQFSFAPATQTTVVTTTTTTTTSFPPLVMHGPRSLRDLDPKQYPLAKASTPESLRNIRFDFNGKSIVFHESENANNDAVAEQQEAIKLSDNVQSTTTTERPPLSSRTNSGHIFGSLGNTTSKRRRISPVPATELFQDPYLNSARPFDLSSPALRKPRRIFSAFTRSTFNPDASEVGLATPETDSAAFIPTNAETHASRISRLDYRLDKQPESSPPAEDDPAESPDNAGSSSELEAPPGLVLDSFTPPTSFKTDHLLPQSRRSRPPIARLTVVDQNNPENIPLPSPRLSPVTTHNVPHRGSPFDSAEDPVTDSDSTGDHCGENTDSKCPPCLKEQGEDTPKPTTETAQEGGSSSLSLLDMPMMLNYFDSIPDRLKAYAMYQLLKRCSKPTLQIVANAVNPALRCDFLAQLPLELGLNIVKYLDVQSMCKASQVSRKWRQIINSDEKSWKAHFDAAGFTLPNGELEKAIEEGWGWQCDDYEKDLRVHSESDSEPDEIVSGSSRRAKRKADSSPFTRSLKRRLLNRSRRGKFELSRWPKDSVTAEGPYAASSAAAKAIPFPSVGLPSLRSIHLYKSLYRRHHLMRKRWMDPDAKPLHIAFRAHGRHVVTCLQFDSEKILTGSDDTNINVYDTKTGALHGTLEGHEGGVWALEYHGNTLVSGSTDRSVRVWDIESAECTQVFQGHTSTVRCLKILLPTKIGHNSDGTPLIMPKEPLIITGSRDSSLRVWKLPQPGDPTYFQTFPDDHACPYFIRALTGHTHSVRAIAAHGDTLVSGSYDNTVKVWKISTGEVVHTLEGHSLKVYSVVLDHQRNRCISGSMDHLVKIWSLDTGALLHTLEGHSLLVGLLDLQGDRLVSAAADSTLRIWDPENGHCKNTLTAHTGAITCFQHDGEKIISGSDRTLKMWNIKTGECMADLLTGLSGVWQVRFNDRRCVAAVQRAGLTYLEVLDFGALRDGVPPERLGRRIVVDQYGGESQEDNDNAGDDNADV